MVLDADKKVIHAVAGEPERAHFSGCAFAARHAMLPKFRADIVISSNGGYPLDQNAYQAVKGMTTAAQCCKDGGVVILAAQCLSLIHILKRMAGTPATTILTG